ncbi:MAG: response regulator [Deltaproteobacteria bacterium]|nr:response regulator [Deltaproteobacteria bacterium]MBW1929627.1 response regulator [Deltaproteobacteria bacterium]MBW2027390.1 response regulator [Deltaproteobacteria bacterium]MBW2126518.1 response regulator [Deltaproteobacteria bacterium]
MRQRSLQKGSHKVLIVDDERAITELLQDVLSTEPYELLSAGSAEEALELLKREPVDVVVSDEMMPGMSGSEFLSIVRRQYPDTIRMILTGHANLEMAIRAINEGEIYRFFRKPCNVFDLAITIRQALQQKALMAEAFRLLKMARRQKRTIEALERKYPGITKVKKDSTGEILLDDETLPQDYDALIQQIRSILTSEIL